MAVRRLDVFDCRPLTPKADFYPRNIFFRLPNIDSISLKKIHQRFGEPQATKIKRLDGAPLGPGVPQFSVAPAQIGIASDEVSDPRIVIADFGEAWFGDTQRRENLNTPVIYLPPECTFATRSIGAPADIWSLGCTIYEIMGERPLFEGFTADRHDIIAEMISCLGMLPRPWWTAWTEREEMFNEDGTWKSDMKLLHDGKPRPLTFRIQKMGRENDPDFSEVEAECLTKLLRAMLTYEPERRPTASELVHSEWMDRYGLPALQQFT